MATTPLKALNLSSDEHDMVNELDRRIRREMETTYDGDAPFTYPVNIEKETPIRVIAAVAERYRSQGWKVELYQDIDETNLIFYGALGIITK